MSDTNQFMSSEAVAPADPGPSRASAAHSSSESIQTVGDRPETLGARGDGIQTQPPRTAGRPEQFKFKKRSFLRRLLIGVGMLFLLYLLAAAVGLVPCSYVSSRVGGRDVVVVSSSPSVNLFSTPEETRIETGSQRVIVHNNVVDLGAGRTVAIPDWCREVRVSVMRGHVSVTFTSP